jgi:glycosyltransferase involved in cell wall biosynthesis
MFLSMIIPVYNTEKYLEECLDSCLSQDLPYEDYEIICINDGSIDGSLDILRGYEARYPNIIVIDQPNGGVSAARNVGIDIAKGDYVWFIDSDDLIRSNSLKMLLELVQQTTCDVLSFRMYLFDDVLQPQQQAQFQLGQLLSNTSLVAQPTMLIRREILADIRWREKIEVGEDSIFLRELYLKQIRQHHIDHVLYLYRQHAQSAIHSAQRSIAPSRIRSHVQGAMIMRDIYLAPNGRCEANANYLMMFLVYAMVSIARNMDEPSKEALRTLKEEKLFPFSRPAECTKRDAFTTNRKDFIGKLYNNLCLYSHTRTGFFLLRLWFLLYRILKK